MYYSYCAPRVARGGMAADILCYHITVLYQMFKSIGTNYPGDLYREWFDLSA